MSIDYRAPEEHQGVNKFHSLRDTRRASEKFFSEVVKYDHAIIAAIIIYLVAFFVPIAPVFLIPVGIIFTIIACQSRINKSLPMKLPISTGNVLDYNDPKEGQDNAYNKARGTIFLGNIRKGLKQLWLNGKDLLTHMLVIGTTGGGKTEALVSLSASTAFSMGGGLVYVDAKGAPKLIAQFFTLARMFGREDDLRVINYSTGNAEVAERHWNRLSNTTNPFAQGTADNGTQTLTGLLPANAGENQVFLDKAIALVKTLFPVLVELRNRGILNITPSLIGDFISLEKFMELSKNIIKVYDVEYQNVTLSERVLKPLQTYLKAQPGFDPNKSPKSQPEEVSRQFGFAEMYFSRTLANLAGTYGHIYQTELAEADFTDIILNGRILIVLVPAMEQAGEERAALGKVVLSSIRTAMGIGLGALSEGKREDVLDSLPIDLKIPTIIVVDEYAEVATEGFAVTATQGRGLGISVIFAGQDMAGFIRASKEEADMIFGNTRLKMLLALEDPEETWSRFKKLAGEMAVAKGSGWERSDDGINAYKSNLTTSIQTADRINLNDLKEQREGQAHVFERANIHRARIFYHGISDDKLIKEWRYNRMLKIKPPTPDQVSVLQGLIDTNIHLNEFKKIEHKDPLLDILAGAQSYIEDSEWPIRLLKSLNTKADSEERKSDIKSQTTDSVNGVMENKSNDLLHQTLDNVVHSHDMTEKQPNNKPTDRSSQLDTSISKVVNNKENKFLLSIGNDEHALCDVKAIKKELMELNIITGIDKQAAEISADNTIESISEAIVYPSTRIVPEQNDIDLLWEALEDSNQN